MKKIVFRKRYGTDGKQEYVELEDGSSFSNKSYNARIVDYLENEPWKLDEELDCWYFEIKAKAIINGTERTGKCRVAEEIDKHFWQFLITRNCPEFVMDVRMSGKNENIAYLSIPLTKLIHTFNLKRYNGTEEEPLYQRNVVPLEHAIIDYNSRTLKPLYEKIKNNRFHAILEGELETKMNLHYTHEEFEFSNPTTSRSETSGSTSKKKEFGCGQAFLILAISFTVTGLILSPFSFLGFMLYPLWVGGGLLLAKLLENIIKS